MLKKSFKIDNNLYSSDIVLEAINDFEGFSLTFTDSILDISAETDAEIQQIFGEFMNYVLALYNEKN